MPEKHKKICLECLREFESPGSKNCPHCGSDRWNFLNKSGAVVDYIHLARLTQERRAGEPTASALVAKYHPETVAM